MLEERLAGGALVAAALTAPEIAAGYGTYTTWFAGTSFSSWLSTGTGAAVFSYLESAYTLKGLVTMSGTERGVSAGANLVGQFVYNDFKIDNKINWAQPIIAGLTKNPFWGNTGQSFVDLNYNSNLGSGFKAFGDSKFNFFDSNFFTTFGSNLFGSALGDGLELKGLTYKPIENILNFGTKSFSELSANNIGNSLKHVNEAVNKSLESSKQEGFGSKGKSGF